jgi:hypothetical protein
MFKRYASLKAHGFPGETSTMPSSISRVPSARNHLFVPASVVKTTDCIPSLLCSEIAASRHRAIVTILENDEVEEIGLVAEAALLSERALKKDWNRDEEDEAWSHLQQDL